MGEIFADILLGRGRGVKIVPRVTNRGPVRTDPSRFEDVVAAYVRNDAESQTYRRKVDRTAKIHNARIPGDVTLPMTPKHSM